MATATALCRASCCATSSRVTLAAAPALLAGRRRLQSTQVPHESLAPTTPNHPTARALSEATSRESTLLATTPLPLSTSVSALGGAVTLPFFTPPPLLAPRPGHGIAGAGRGGTDPDDPHHHHGHQQPDPTSEEEVDDREWEMRVAHGMLHLRETLPLLFSGATSKELFPDDIYSKHLVLRLPPLLPLKVSSLHGYTMVFNLARNAMQALNTDLSTELERMTFTPAPPPESPQAAAREALLGRAPTHRQKQLRILLNVTGTPRLPPHKEAQWHASSLYTFSPYSGLIVSHEIETIRPLPGEGVVDQLTKALLGWTTRGANAEGAMAGPRMSDGGHDPAVRCKGRSEE